MNQNRRASSVQATKEGIEKLEAQRISKGWCRKQLASKAKIHLDTYERFIGGKNIFRDSVRKIVEVLDLQPTDIVASDEWFGIPSPKPSPEPPEIEIPSYYIERPPIEERCYEAIKHPGSLIRIKAPQQMGKTLLVDRILVEARKQNYQTVTLSFELPDSTVFNDTRKFSQWFCASVGKPLGLANKLAHHWDDIFGCNDNTTAYFEEYLLVERASPMVLALDKVDRVFEHSAIANDFCCLLRGWYDMAKRSDRRGEIWKKLRLVVAHSTEVYSSLDINSSPLKGVGVIISLPEFNQAQVQDLAQRYGLDWLSRQEVEQLMAIVGGHPYLVQIALDYLKSQEHTLLNLLQIASTEASPFVSYLRKLLWDVQSYPELAKALHQVVTANNPTTLEPAQTFKLDSMGLIRIQGNSCSPRCNLYRQYFLARLT
ncbi:AAA-like domain-containing protein [Aetokthonos hydrillicola Thurmond2011]|jgi:hypothetical protein|uniref:AAA-like domain-containing protein n=1 Tax=Aetokthonos hydrillicola Thurmond2011 TaxID=2712845 RepID=A0AAP5MC29_9CYAN|nr:AAA-like domain-containing protein [Aetokthonos hydrillicola]MBO3461975.1 hypothetical protein [Aetokthonos hydrillicola CCALA 1050]MBW4589139.1 AAA-like domain-containing protein [Aetokthonos hydrillicola CCALA 1050]MDR9898697.1 AAA-like domain-containing protein [Aetokthonos hydrillicola Thurmond2011]